MKQTQYGFEAFRCSLNHFLIGKFFILPISYVEYARALPWRVFLRLPTHVLHTNWLSDKWQKIFSVRLAILMFNRNYCLSSALDVITRLHELVIASCISDDQSQKSHVPAWGWAECNFIVDYLNFGKVILDNRRIKRTKSCWSTIFLIKSRNSI